MQGTIGEKQCNLGVFCTQNMSEISENNNTYDSYYNIPFSENCFLFFTENDQIHYFHLNYYESEISYFGYYAVYQDQNISLSFNEAIFINIEQLSQTTVDFETSQFKMLNLGQPPKNNMPDVISDFIIKKIEYWVVKSSVLETVQNQTVMIQNFFSKQA